MPIQIVQPQREAPEQPKPDIFDQILKGLQIAGGVTGLAVDVQRLKQVKAQQDQLALQTQNEQKGVINPMQQAELASKGFSLSSGDEGPMPRDAIGFQTPEGAPVFARPEPQQAPPKLEKVEIVRDGRKVRVSYDPVTGQEYSAMDLGAVEPAAPKKGTYKEYTDSDGNTRGGIVIDGRIQMSPDDPIVKPAQPKGDEKGKQIPASVVTEISQFDAAEKALKNLDEVYKKKATSWYSGAAQFVPGTEAASYADNRRAAAQTIGTIMEGGKLTDPDFQKYWDLLPAPDDSDKRAQEKINNLSQMMADKKKSIIEGLQSSGYAAEGIRQDSAYKSSIAGEQGGGSFGEAVADELSPQDIEAIQWARKNPNDPRAQEILKELGFR